MLKLNSLCLTAALAVAVAVAGCQTPPPAAAPQPPALFVQAFQARGVIQELQPDGKTVVIRHEEIPGHLPARVTPFTVQKPEELRGLAAGDPVSFQLIVSADGKWIEQVEKIGGPAAGR